MGQLDGKVAIVTGASSGIGAETARQLAAEGASVTLAARRLDRLEALKKEIESAGAKALVVQTDITDEKQVRQLIERTVTEYGGLDILVNNAGVMLLSRAEKGRLEHWRRMLEVNVWGVFTGSYYAIEPMRKRGGGHIVNISSNAGRRVFETASVYCATKFAINAFAEALRMEVIKDNIRVTSIEPGFVETELQGHNTDPEIVERTRNIKSILDPLQSEDIARAVVYAVTQPPHVSANELLIRPTKSQT